MFGVVFCYFTAAINASAKVTFSFLKIDNFDQLRTLTEK
jgi:hypothetical protein